MTQAVIHPMLIYYNIAMSYKKLSYHRGTAWCAVSVKTVLNVTQIFVKLHLISPALGE